MAERWDLLLLVRNPNWDSATDFRPAYADSVMVWEGNGWDLSFSGLR